MDLQEKIRLKIESTDPIRAALPLEYFSTKVDLRFFLELFLLIQIKEYIPKTDSDHFYASVELDKATKSVIMRANITEISKHVIPEQAFVLAHEAAHILLSHLVKMSKYDNQRAANIAEDAVINSLLNKYYSGALEQISKNGKKIGITVESLINDEFLPKDFLQNRKVEDITSDEIYDILVRRENERKINLVLLDGDRIDDHDAIPMPDDLDGEIKDVIDNMIKNASSGEFGDTTADFVKELMEIIRKKFPFNQVLDMMLYKEKYNFDRPSRRIRLRNPDGSLKKSFFPRKRNEKFKVYAGLDISGSCEDYTEDFLGYIVSLPEFEEIVFIDTDIKNIVKKGEPIPPIISGYGGTDMNPLMKRWEEIEKNNKVTAKLNFILLTDGEIPELEYGPRNSKVIIFTVNEVVNFVKATKPYINIVIEKGGNE